MSNFPLSYRLSWLPRLLVPALGAGDPAFGPVHARWLEPRRSVRLVFAGDVSAVANRDPPTLDPALRAILAAADLVVANCESPVVEQPHAALGTALGIRHAMSPRFLDAALDSTGIAPGRLVLSLANNHAFDQGAEGFAETVAALDSRGIRLTGLVSAGPLTSVDAGPVRIAFRAFTCWRNVGRDQFSGRVWLADEFAPMQPSGADLVCALPHWDREFRHRPQAATRELAGALAGQGCGLVVGGHAHVVQPVERIGGALVAYGLGDLFGTVLPVVRWPLRLGALLEVEVSADDGTRGRLAGYRVHPFVRERAGRREHLRPLGGGGSSDALAAARADAIFPTSERR